jgi:uncharacterized repeat protein (TIGR03803 family)
MDSSQNESTLYSFTGSSDGMYPRGGLIRDSTGNLYGATAYGGGSGCGGQGCGTVYRIDASGQEEVLYRFKGGKDGATPSGRLARDSAGSLYGTTDQGGGEGCLGYGCGTVFKVNKAGKEQVLHRFSGGADGEMPFSSSIVLDESGNLYGTTGFGGTSGYGVVFKISSAGKETVLYNFAEDAKGGVPEWGVTRDAKGNLYGTTLYGGDHSCRCGVVFKLTP